MDAGLPPKPEKPLDSDCCGNSCSPCVLDIYAEELAAWEKECARIQGGSASALAQEDVEQPSSPVLSTIKYQQYQIADIVQETQDTRRYTCRLGHSQHLGLLPGQHVLIRGYCAGRSITRQYTPVSDVTAKGYFQLLIKIYEDGRMSRIVEQWKVGDWLDIRGPFGSLQYSPNQYQRILMLAGGTGVAPMAQLILAALANADEEGRLRLVLASRTYHLVPLRQQIREWQRFWNFSAALVLSRKESADPTGVAHFGEEIHYGKINKGMLATELGTSYDGTRVLICGTRSFDTDMQQILKDLQFPGEHIFRF